MRRILSAGIVVLGLPLGSLALAPGLAGASGSVDATTAVISCAKVHGTVTFNPPLTNTGITNETITFTETVSSCSPTGVAATVTKGAVTAKLKTDLPAQGFPSACDLIGDASDFGTNSKGSVAWTSSPALSSGDTKFKVAPLHWTTDGSEQVNALGWSFGTPSGSFQGPNHGEYDQAWADSTITANAAFNDCESSSGLSSLKLKTASSQFAPMLLGGPNPE